MEDAHRMAHNPEVAGSSRPRYQVKGPFRTWKGPLACCLLTGSWSGRRVSVARLVRLGGERCFAGQGVIAISAGFLPTLIGLPAVLVAVQIGVTVPEFQLAT